jgi:outer membrane protein assembly factor BamD (BamD/ComL family)
MKKQLLAWSMTSLVFLGGCSTTEEDKIAQIKLQGPEASYQEAKNAMKNGNFNGAAEMLSALDSRYPLVLYPYKSSSI